ncbi:hypothetical protein PanWU01x14_119600 [Parasponia andersonii]|uniref:Uncharacterized protein n=1 Tax=Parasponia andersonii TaxID=3476 RepID=A0A2P5CVF1_PARAD|nr:hypothetical protein PanWU01x14_119600 [Parasponia andersonii]
MEKIPQSPRLRGFPSDLTARPWALELPLGSYGATLCYKTSFESCGMALGYEASFRALQRTLESRTRTLSLPTLALPTPSLKPRHSALKLLKKPIIRVAETATIAPQASRTIATNSINDFPGMKEASTLSFKEPASGGSIWTFLVEEDGTFTIR